MSSVERNRATRFIAYPTIGALCLVLVSCGERQVDLNDGRLHHSTGQDSEETVVATYNPNGSREITYQTATDIHSKAGYHEGYERVYHQYCDGGSIQSVEWTSQGKLPFEGRYPHLYSKPEAQSCEDNTLSTADNQYFNDFLLPKGDGLEMPRQWEPPK